MRRPDTQETKTYRGIECTVSTWVDPTEFAWDGDCELEPGSEGYDIYVEVRATIDGHNFEGRDSLGSVWILPNREGRTYLNDEIANVTGEAVYQLFEEVRRVATGEGVKAAMARQVAAMRALSEET